jgi:hypothetical protein
LVYSLLSDDGLSPLGYLEEGKLVAKLKSRRYFNVSPLPIAPALPLQSTALFATHSKVKSC